MTSDEEERVWSASEQRARGIVGDALDDADEDDDITPYALGETITHLEALVEQVRGGIVIASADIAASRRTALEEAAAQLKVATAAFINELGTCRDLPRLLSVLRPEGLDATMRIAHGLVALNRSELLYRNDPPRELLLRLAMYEAAYAWVDITHELPAGPCDPYAQFCNALAGTGAEFIYRVLAEASWGCTRDEIMANLDAANRHVAAVRFGEEEDDEV